MWVLLRVAQASPTHHPSGVPRAPWDSATAVGTAQAAPKHKTPLKSTEKLFSGDLGHPPKAATRSRAKGRAADHPRVLGRHCVTTRTKSHPYPVSREPPTHSFWHVRYLGGVSKQHQPLEQGRQPRPQSLGVIFYLWVAQWEETHFGAAPCAPKPYFLISMK